MPGALRFATFLKRGEIPKDGRLREDAKKGDDRLSPYPLRHTIDMVITGGDDEWWATEGIIGREGGLFLSLNPLLTTGQQKTSRWPGARRPSQQGGFTLHSI